MRLSRPSPATLVACAALFVALGGTAIAASRYVVTSTSQIKPSVLSTLTASGPWVRVTSPKPTPVIPAGKHINALRVVCQPGYHVVSGGYFGDLAPGAYLTADEPEGTNSWSVIVDSAKATQASEMILTALCAPGRVSLLGVTSSR